MERIFITLMSIGLFVRGILFYLVSNQPIDISISSSKDWDTYSKENRLGFKAYITIGGIFSFFIIVLDFLYPRLFTNYFIISIIAILVVDFLIHSLIKLRIKLDNYYKNKEDL